MRLVRLTAASFIAAAVILSASAGEPTPQDEAKPTQASASAGETAKMSYTAFAKAVREDAVATATFEIYGGVASGMTRLGADYEVVVPADLSYRLAETLESHGADVTFLEYSYDEDVAEDLGAAASSKNEGLPPALRVMFNLLPFLIFLVFIVAIYFFAQKSNKGYYARAEKMQADFFANMEKILREMQRDG